MTRAPKQRVLIWAPKGRNAELALQLLAQANIIGEMCPTLDTLCSSFADDVGCAILTEEALLPAASEQIARRLAVQPPWSDLPVIVYYSRDGTSLPQPEIVDRLGNLSMLNRPVSARAFLAAVHAAFRSRNRQYQARDAIRHRDVFLAMLGHELRNPLNAISLAMELLDAHGTAVDARARAILAHQTRHLTRLVDDLLDVSRVTSDKLSLTRAPLELNALVLRVVASNEASAHAKAQRLMVATAPEPLQLSADVHRLEQVLNNLVHNAVKYSPDGTSISITTRAVGDCAEIAVRDEGVGISAEMLPKIFELFTQVTASLARSQGGLGIGLTLVRRLVELHGGQVSVTSPGLDRGSTFTVKLPIERVLPKPELVAIPRIVRPSSLRVVLVDDSEDMREMGSALLEMLGCEVHTSADGPTGLACILEQQPDLALVDIGLPVLDGFGVARGVRSKLGATPMLVAVTGYGQPADRQNALDAGFDEHVTKPITKQAVTTILASAASRALARRAG